MTKPKPHIQLRRRLEALSLPFSSFGRLLGRPRSTVYQWTSGHQEIPDYVLSMVAALEEMTERQRERFCADLGVGLKKESKNEGKD